MSVFFISDLHLNPSQQAITDRFLKFLEGEAKNADALYILGDFFEIWVGDDALDPHDTQVMKKLAEYASKIPTFLMHGNRDFLIRSDFLQKSGMTLLSDPYSIQCFGKQILLMHGDTLCSNDIKYQRFRRFVRNPFIKWLYLKLPLWVRKKIARHLRKNSIANHSKPAKDPSLYEATSDAIQKVFRQYKMDILIHGHTHQPMIENRIDEGREVQRIVLGDWGKKSTILEFSSKGPFLRELSL